MSVPSARAVSASGVHHHDNSAIGLETALKLSLLGELGRNPARQADPPALPRSRAQAWTASELRRFLDHVSDERLFAAWRVAATPACAAASYPG